MPQPLPVSVPLALYGPLTWTRDAAAAAAAASWLHGGVWGILHCRPSGSMKRGRRGGGVDGTGRGVVLG